MTDLAKLVVKLEAQTAEYDRKLEEATRRLSAFKRANDSLLSGLGNRLAAAFTVGALVAWGKAVLDNAENLKNLSQASGVSVRELGGLQVAARASGADLDTLATGLRQLNKSISEAAGNASSEAAVAFRAMGIAVKDANGNLIPTAEILKQVADRFAGYRDGANKAALAQALLGRGGTELIPMLNAGAAGLAEFQKQAEQAGLVLDEATADKLEKFGNQLGLIKDSLVKGLGSAILSDLLPSLENLGAAWDKAGDKTRAYSQIGETVGNFFRVIASGAIYAFGVLSDFGTVLGGVGAAAVAVAHGNFSEAKDILGSIGADLEQQDADTMRRIRALWDTAAKDQANFIAGTSQTWKREAPNVAGTKALEDAARKSVDKLREMYTQLSEQVATFDQTSAAATRYRLTVGSLAKDVQAAGAAGEQFSAGIIGLAEGLDSLKDSKEIADGLRDVDAQIRAIQGDATGAALIQFDQSNAELVRQLNRQGNEAGLAQVETLRTLIGYQAQYNQLQQQAASIQADLALAEERIRNSQQTGALTELGALTALDKARTDARDKLQGVAAAMDDIAKKSGSPEQLRGVRDLGGAIDSLSAQTNLLGQRFKATFEDALGGAIEGLLTGTKSVGDAVKGILMDIEAQLAKMVARDLVGRLFSSLGGGGGGGGAGGILGMIGGLIGGAMDSGGRGSPGQVYAIGRGAQPELFVPDTAGTFYPRGAMAGGGQVVNNYFTVRAEGGNVNRSTQQQIATAAARGMAAAQRRNA